MAHQNSYVCLIKIATIQTKIVTFGRNKGIAVKIVNFQESVKCVTNHVMFALLVPVKINPQLSLPLGKKLKLPKINKVISSTHNCNFSMFIYALTILIFRTAV